MILIFSKSKFEEKITPISKRDKARFGKVPIAIGIQMLCKPFYRGSFTYNSPNRRVGEGVFARFNHPRRDLHGKLTLFQGRGRVC